SIVIERKDTIAESKFNNETIRHSVYAFHHWLDYNHYYEGYYHTVMIVWLCNFVSDDAYTKFGHSIESIVEVKLHLLSRLFDKFDMKKYLIYPNKMKDKYILQLVKKYLKIE